MRGKGSKELNQKEDVMLLLVVKRGKLINLNSTGVSWRLMEKRLAEVKK